ncbi:MAG: nitrous oxide reductase accessory protein NosL [Thermodesulfobacteriota bacterium]
MKRIYIFLTVAFIFCFCMTGISLGQEDIQKYPSCKYCGMNRQQYAHSRVFIEYDDGTSIGTCSIHCAAVELALQLDKTPKAITVGDYGSKALIDVEKAFWVMGGNKMGVMTHRAKWAFEKKEEAEKFIKENGGVIASFDQAIKASYEDMYADTKMIRERRQARRMKMMEEKKMDHKGMEQKHP